MFRNRCNAVFFATIAVTACALLGACSDDPGPAPGAEADMAATTPDSSTTSPDSSTTSPDSSTSDDASWQPRSDAGVEPDGATTPGTEPGEAKATFCRERSAELARSGGNVIEVAPAGPGRVTVDGEEMTLRQAVARAADGDTVLLADGTYTFPQNGDGSSYTGVYITVPNITIRSASGNPEAVVLDSDYRDHGNGSAPITIAAAGVTIADLTVTRSIYHLVHLWEAGDQANLHNLRLVDGGQQFVKSSGNGTIDGVTITCSDFVMTDAGRDNVWGYGAQDGNTTCYTGGIDSHEGRGWTITDNSFEGIYCDASGPQRPAHGMNPEGRGGQTYQGGLAEHAIHMWDSPQNGGGHLIARNQIVDCARGIGLGFRAVVYDIIVRDNMIVSNFAGSREHDVGISAERAQNTAIVHNSVIYTHPDAYPSTIEYRFGSTANLRVANNLTNGRIRARNDATATLEGNVTDAEPGWFVNAAQGDLHLVDCALASVVDAAIGTDASHPDFDHDEREAPADAGADECRP